MADTSDPDAPPQRPDHGNAPAPSTPPLPLEEAAATAGPDEETAPVVRGAFIWDFDALETLVRHMVQHPKDRRGVRKRLFILTGLFVTLAGGYSIISQDWSSPSLLFTVILISVILLIVSTGPKKRIEAYKKQLEKDESYGRLIHFELHPDQLINRGVNFELHTPFAEITDVTCTADGLLVLIQDKQYRWLAAGAFADGAALRQGLQLLERGGVTVHQTSDAVATACVLADRTPTARESIGGPEDYAAYASADVRVGLAVPPDASPPHSPYAAIAQADTNRDPELPPALPVSSILEGQPIELHFAMSDDDIRGAIVYRRIDWSVIRQNIALSFWLSAILAFIIGAVFSRWIETVWILILGVPLMWLPMIAATNLIAIWWGTLSILKNRQIQKPATYRFTADHFFVQEESASARLQYSSIQVALDIRPAVVLLFPQNTVWIPARELDPEQRQRLLALLKGVGVKVSRPLFGLAS